MGMVVNHNISAMNTLRSLNNSNRMMSKSLQKLSSGYRINVGADGPADLIISEQLRAQTVGLQRAVRNTQEAMNVIGIAEGALNEMNEILKTMRQLALHAANNGITSPEQVAADQSEVDSSIQTIDRIANTTKYSTQFLLNGSQDLTYTRETTIDRGTDHTLLDLGRTQFEQIFKKDDFSVNVTFSGATGAFDANGNNTIDLAAGDNAEGYTDGEAQARRAMFEAFSGTNGVAGTDIDTTTVNSLSADQRFTLTGNQGSRSFDFASGTHLGEVVTSINNVADSTGVNASLIFNNEVTGVTQATTTAYTKRTNAGGRGTGEITTYHMNSTFGETLGATQSVTVADAGNGLDNLDVGRNTDGFGRVWLKWSSATAFEVYKDEDFTMKIGEGTSGAAISWIRDASPESTAGDLTFTAGAGVAADDITMVQLGNAHELDGTAAAAGGEFDTSLMTDLGLDDMTDGSNTFSGIQLGYNTDANGKLYFKVEDNGAGANDTVRVYKDSAMEDSDLVAEATGVDLAVAAEISVDLIATKLNNGAGPSSGLYATVVFDGTTMNGAGVSSIKTGELSMQNLGVRLYSEEYGAGEYVKVDVQEGSLWSYYKDANDNSNRTLLDASSGAVSTTTYGQNATVSVNGRQLELDGIGGTVATQDLNAEFVFNEGQLGLTTVAQVGYGVGSLYSAATDINDVGTGPTEGNYATNAIQNTSEVISNFVGGMQFQLGEGAGDQERTTYAIRSMAVTQLGSVNFYDDFSGGGLKEDKTLTLQDVLGGGLASLASDPVKSLRIIDQAIEDVSELRARLGAFQKNMLQTNANSLNVAIENITSTESDIRDANMAQETTDFTKNQILVQAGTAMLAQANVASQNVLQLLG